MTDTFVTDILESHGVSPWDFNFRGRYGRVYLLGEEVLKVGDIAATELEALREGLPGCPRLISAGSGWVLMTRTPGQPLTREKAYHRDFPRECARALKALHDAGWVHGDIHRGNVLVEDGHFSGFVDLGFARRSSEHRVDLDPFRWRTIFRSEYDLELFEDTYYGVA